MLWHDNTNSQAAHSIHLNIAEGASGKSVAERKRFYDIARSSLIEVNAALDVANDLQYLTAYNTEQLSILIIRAFKILCGMMAS